MGYLGNKPADSYLTLEKQTFTTSATDTYTLDRAVSSVNDIELFLNNVRQEPTEAYTISGTTLTLASAITASDSMYCIYQGRAVGTQSPAVGSVTNDMLEGSINESKLLGSIPNSKLANSSVTVNGTSISLGSSGTISVSGTISNRFYAYGAGSASNASGWRTQNYATEVIDDNNSLDIGTAQYVIPHAGTYVLFAGHYHTNGSHSDCLMRFHSNHHGFIGGSGITNTDMNTITMLHDASSSEVIQVRVYHSNTAHTDGGGRMQFFGGYRIE